MSAMSYLITSLTIVYSTVYSGADQRRHQNSASLAFVRGIHRSLVTPPPHPHHPPTPTTPPPPTPTPHPPPPHPTPPPPHTQRASNAEKVSIWCVIMWTDRPTSSWWLQICWCQANSNKQRVLMHGHQGWNVRHGLCHIYMIYVYIWVVYSFCLFCCLFIIVTTQFVALYKPCKPKPKPSAYDPPDNHPLAEIQIPILRPEPKQRICHQHANTDHFGK